MKIKQLQGPDHRALKMLAHCGNVATADLLVTGVTLTRIKSYKRDGLISEVLYSRKRQQPVPNCAWGVTSAGRKFIERNLRIKVASSKNAVRHNLAVAHEYANLISSMDGVTIFSEIETRDIIEQRLEDLKNTDIINYLPWYDAYAQKKMSMPDITCITMDDSSHHCIEVVTKTYGQQQIEEKRLTATFLDADLTFVYI